MSDEVQTIDKKDIVLKLADMASDLIWNSEWSSDVPKFNGFGYDYVDPNYVVNIGGRSFGMSVGAEDIDKIKLLPAVRFQQKEYITGHRGDTICISVAPDGLYPLIIHELLRVNSSEIDDFMQRVAETKDVLYTSGEVLVTLNSALKRIVKDQLIKWAIREDPGIGSMFDGSGKINGTDFIVAFKEGSKGKARYILRRPTDNCMFAFGSNGKRISGNNLSEFMARYEKESSIFIR